VEREGSFEEEYSEKSEYFVAINRDKLEQLKEQLNL
jgi:hypothetical protein